jgi:hypothetical protein
VFFEGICARPTFGDGLPQLRATVTIANRFFQWAGVGSPGARSTILQVAKVSAMRPLQAKTGGVQNRYRPAVFPLRVSRATVYLRGTAEKEEKAECRCQQWRGQWSFR